MNDFQGRIPRSDDLKLKSRKGFWLGTFLLGPVKQHSPVDGGSISKPASIGPMVDSWKAQPGSRVKRCW